MQTYFDATLLAISTYDNPRIIRWRNEIMTYNFVSGAVFFTAASRNGSTSLVRGTLHERVYKTLLLIFNKVSQLTYTFPGI